MWSSQIFGDQRAGSSTDTFTHTHFAGEKTEAQKGDVTKFTELISDISKIMSV